MFARLGGLAAAAFGGAGGHAAPPSAEGLSPTAYRQRKEKGAAAKAAAAADSAEEGEDEDEEAAGEDVMPVAPSKKVPVAPKKEAKAPQRLRLGNKELGNELDVALAEWVRCHLPRGRFPPSLQRGPHVAAHQFEKGLGATAQDDVADYYKDPTLSKGKRPGEIEAGNLLCDALKSAGVTEAKTTWSTLDKRCVKLIDESQSWFSAFGSCDKMPTGRAKTTRVFHNAEKGVDETEDWPFQPWMWTFMRLGKQRAGKAQEERVKKEEQGTADDMQRAERTVAALKAQILSVPAAEKEAVRARLDAAQDRLLDMSGGRRGKRAKRRRPSGEEDDCGSGEGSSDDDDPSGKGARKGASAADAGLGAVLDAAKETSALMKESLASMTALSRDEREFQAAEREKDRQHAERMHQAGLAAQQQMMMEMFKAMTKK